MSDGAKSNVGTTVSHLRVLATASREAVVDDVSFEIEAGEILGLVGESGSGKTTVGLALLGYCRDGLGIAGGSVTVGGSNILAMSSRARDELRGRTVFYMPQDPGTALNPFLRIRTQLIETFASPESVDDATLRTSLAEVRLPMEDRLLRAHAHELSGGQQQRITIAMAFSNRPKLIVMDEPTTGLDVTTQAHVLDTIRKLCRDHGVSALYVSHDLAVVAQLAMRVAVMQKGRIVEVGDVAQVLGAPQHSYTRSLISAVPRIEQRSCVRTQALSLEKTAQPLLKVEGLSATYGRSRILHNVSLTVPCGAVVGLVGESGSGKTTLARCIAGLHQNMAGHMLFRDTNLSDKAAARPRDQRKRIQYIFQNPYSSLNPQHTIGRSIETVIALFETLPKATMRDRVLTALEQVALPLQIAERYPRELSGGQRQRAAIARALVVEPDLLICDEITSALDVSVQARVIELLQSLQERRGLSMLFVTHNLPLVANIAQRIVVMQSGRIAEDGETDVVLGDHGSEETQRLLRDTPAFPYSPRSIP
jgi:peptide/nickel transport system ATP-binding protein